ncbi:MAG: hypothetical protein HY924_06535 [Elusimicrobia bacterium]|nr:hypothetical protein [Elusimicrobiota bacterium]
MSPLDCLAVGLTTVDVLALVDGPVREDEKILSSATLLDGGGPAGTAACAMARFGLRTGLLSFIGKDEWAPFVLGGLQRFGVSTRFVRQEAGLRTPLSLVLVNERNASRTIVWNSAGIGKQRWPGPVPRTRCLHCDGHLMELSISLARRLKGARVSYDCGSVKPGWERLAALSDVFIASHKFSRQLGWSIPRTVQRLRGRFGFEVAVTAGENGVHYWDAGSGKVRLMRQRRYAAVDTTGCGDVFHGAFLASYLKGKGFAESLAFGQRVAGLKTLKLGGRAGIPVRV